MGFYQKGKYGIHANKNLDLGRLKYAKEFILNNNLPMTKDILKLVKRNINYTNLHILKTVSEYLKQQNIKKQTNNITTYPLLDQIDKSVQTLKENWPARRRYNSQKQLKQQNKDK